MPGKDAIIKLREHAPVVLPSLLLCDFGNLANEIARLEDAGVQGLHLDVMDGVFVPNFTYGITLVDAIRKLTDLPLDVHLMMVHPEKYVAQFCEAGADILTVHAEAVERPDEVLDSIRTHGAAAGIAINPGTPVSEIAGCLGNADLCLIMSVNAGFGGQSFEPVALEKLREVREIDSDILLQIDGGVNPKTIASCREAGAELLVVGSAIFRQPDYGVAIDGLQQQLTACQS